MRLEETEDVKKKRRGKQMADMETTTGSDCTICMYLYFQPFSNRQTEDAMGANFL